MAIEAFATFIMDNMDIPFDINSTRENLQIISTFAYSIMAFNNSFNQVAPSFAVEGACTSSITTLADEIAWATNVIDLKMFASWVAISLFLKLN